MGAIGKAVPLILAPRFTTYAGAGVFTTAPVDVSEFSMFSASVWRGPLVGMSGAAFETKLQVSHDTITWFDVGTPYTTPEVLSVEDIDLKYRWLRLWTELTADSNDVVAITLWASGLLERRLP